MKASGSGDATGGGWVPPSSSQTRAFMGIHALQQPAAAVSVSRGSQFIREAADAERGVRLAESWSRPLADRRESPKEVRRGAASSVPARRSSKGETVNRLTVLYGHPRDPAEFDRYYNEVHI